jgi:phosphatidylinositol alpha 1,6-mannosyltransferase
MTNAPRVALFTDSYHEANGVARTTSALEAYAAAGERPLLIVHAGPATQLVETGSIVRLEVRRAERTSFSIEHDLRFDVALWRHARRVARVLKRFRPDVLHFTGPSDVGLLGAGVGYRLNIPMVGSWHTNLHEYGSRRLKLAWAAEAVRWRTRRWVERHALDAVLLFYRTPRVILAPNPEWLTILESRTGKPGYLMTRGVDVDLFAPSRRTRTDDDVNIGYVGRLSPEKNVRALAALERHLAGSSPRQVRFTIVGDGSEREWLRREMPHAEFTGVLRGRALADAYANMDLFVFPSETETVGNVILEAMASGVPSVAMARGGHRSIADPAATLIAGDEFEFIELASALVHDTGRRKTMAASARARATERSWTTVFDTVYRAYAAAILLAAAPHAVGDPLVRRSVEKQPSA